MARRDATQRMDRVPRSSPREVYDLLDRQEHNGSGPMLVDARPRLIWGWDEERREKKRARWQKAYRRRRGKAVDAWKKFDTGQIVATPGALEELLTARTTAKALLRRHLAGDWGDVDDEDWRANDDALRTGDRLLSAYALTTGVRVWIVTEADRSYTTVLLPEEY